MHYKSKNTCLLHLFVVCILHVLVFQPGYPCGGRGTARQSLFSPSIVWDPGIELTLSGLVISTFTGLVILPVYEYNNFIMKNRTTTKTQPALRLSVFRLLLLAMFQSVLLQLCYHCPFYCREMGPVSLASPYRDHLQKYEQKCYVIIAFAQGWGGTNLRLLPSCNSLAGIFFWARGTLFPLSLKSICIAESF